MKKHGIRILLFGVLLTFLTLPAAAEEILITNGGLEEEYATFRDAIPPEIAEILGKEITEGELAHAEQALREHGGLDAVLRSIGRLTGLSIRENLALLARLCALLLFSATLRALFPGRTSGTQGAFSLCAALTTVVAILLSQQARLSQLEGYFDTVKALSVGFLPLMGSLYAMGGNLRAAVVNHGVMSAFLSVLETLCAGTVLPIAGICLALTIPEALTGRVELRPIAGLIKRTYTLSVSFLMLLLCGVLGAQSTLAKAGDSLALRTARFAAGSFLPVVGGSISQTLGTVAGSVEYLRSIAGTSAITVLFFCFLPPFLSLLVTRIAFLLAGAVAKMLSCKAEEVLLTELASVYGYFLAIISSLFVMLIFSLTLFARCAAA